MALASHRNRVSGHQCAHNFQQGEPIAVKDLVTELQAQTGPIQAPSSRLPQVPRIKQGITIKPSSAALIKARRAARYWTAARRAADCAQTSALTQLILSGLLSTPPAWGV